ncbi:phage tail protein [Burkholderia anthina]|uniref:phage tail protein n=1 Tax=Burkholderia anthina TaxID=179879 RepID=UPI0037BE89C9
MSAPENSNSKTPPSLLSDTKPAGEGGRQQSRILADLEGRVAPSAEPARRSLKGPIAAVVALVIAVGGWGAWRWQQQSGESAVVAAAPAPATAKAEPASGAAQVAQNVASAASAVQPATIVNEDAASETVASASSASGADNSRLSRALANGADDTPGAATAGAAAATAAAVATTKTAKADAAKSDKVAARSKAEAKADAKAEARKHHKEQVELAQAKKRRETAARTGGARASGKDDPDADLLAALVARTKPADKKGAAQKAQQAGPTKTAAATGGSLASRVKDCSARGFFEDQLCRWRVCEGHWGKDPACPTAAQSETRQ